MDCIWKRQLVVALPTSLVSLFCWQVNQDLKIHSSPKGSGAPERGQGGPNNHVHVIEKHTHTHTYINYFIYILFIYFIFTYALLKVLPAWSGHPYEHFFWECHSLKAPVFSSIHVTMISVKKGENIPHRMMLSPPEQIFLHVCSILNVSSSDQNNFAVSHVFKMKGKCLTGLLMNHFEHFIFATSQ